MKNFVNIVGFSIRKQLIIPLLISALAATVMGSAYASSLTMGDDAPNFTVTTLTGTSVNLSDFVSHKPVYLKFWATWCSYCKVEMPHLQAIYDENGDDIEVLTINVGMNDSINNINNFYQKNGFTLPTVFDQKGELTSQYGVVGTPYHVLIDKQGKIAYQTFLATDQLDEIISKWSTKSNKKLATKVLNKVASKVVSKREIK
jgi:peroxiredoxin